MMNMFITWIVNEAVLELASKMEAGWTYGALQFTDMD